MRGVGVPLSGGKAYDELAILDGNVAVLKDIFKSKCPLHGY